MPVPGTDVQETEVTVQPSGEAEVKEFRIAAKQFAFDPATIEVNKGDKVRLIVESVDVPHGIALPDYGIKERLDPYQPKTIEFVADKEGIFTFYCFVACGATTPRNERHTHSELIIVGLTNKSSKEKTNEKYAIFAAIFLILAILFSIFLLKTKRCRKPINNK